MALKLTCINCRVAFSDPDVHRQHYKTDWHRYNLKRKIAELPPISAEEFSVKVIEQRQNEEDGSKETALFCKICRKAFGSVKAFENHVNSKKHRLSLEAKVVSGDSETCIDVDNISEPLIKTGPKVVTSEILGPLSGIDSTEVEGCSDSETDSGTEEVDSDEWSEECNEISDDNPIIHNDCLFCTHHSAKMTKNVKHMANNHSFFIPDVDYLTDLRGLLIYLGEKICTEFVCLWCDKRSKSFYSLESVQRHMRDKGHCKILYEGAALAQYTSFYNYAKSYPDNEENMDIDEDVIIPELDDANYELVLPSGAKIGHRDLVLYYRQNINPHREIIVKKTKVGHLMATYRALGWSTADKEAEARRARDMRYIRTVQSKFFTKVGVKANKLQKHFRPQVNF